LIVEKKKDLRVLFVILLLGFVLRLSLLAVAMDHPERTYFPDSDEYISKGVAFLETGRYPADDALRTPLYPLLIALAYAVGGQAPVAVVAVQVLLSALTVWMTYALGMRLLPRPAALIGAFLMAISLESITQSFFILTETFFAFLFLAMMLTLVRAIQEDRLGWLAASGALLGLAVLCRPVGLYFAILPAVSFLFEKRRWLERLARVGIWLGLFLAVLFPWLLRNISVLGVPTISTAGSHTLLYYDAASLEADLRGTDETTVREEMFLRVDRELAARGLEDTPINRDRLQGEMAREIILAHPFRYAYLHLKADTNSLLPSVNNLTEILGLTAGGRGTLSVLNQEGLAAAIRNYFGEDTWLIWVFSPLILLLALTYLADVLGLVDLVRRREWLTLAVLVLPVLYLLGLVGATATPRFRVPVMPSLCLLAGPGVAAAWEWLRKHKKQTRPQRP